MKVNGEVTKYIGTDTNNLNSLSKSFFFFFLQKLNCKQDDLQTKNIPIGTLYLYLYVAKKNKKMLNPKTSLVRRRCL